MSEDVLAKAWDAAPAAPAVPVFEWHALSPEQRERAQQLFGLGWSPDGDAPRIRAALLPGPSDARPLIRDTAVLTERPEAWRSLFAGPDAPRHMLYKCLQVEANRKRFGGALPCELQRGQYAGRPAYLVASGPSAAAGLAAAPLPPRGTRRGVVLAVGDARSLVPDPDVWVLWDALWICGPEERARRLAAWAARPAEGVAGAFATHAGADAVASFMAAGGRPSFFQAAHATVYRGLAPDALPSIQEGVQTTLSALHLAQWLGCAPVVLLGVDCGRPVAPAGAEAPPPSGRALHAAWQAVMGDSWVRVPGIAPMRIETQRHMVKAAFEIAAVCMWLADAGVEVRNAGAGLDLAFATPAPWAATLARLEGA